MRLDAARSPTYVLVVVVCILWSAVDQFTFGQSPTRLRPVAEDSGESISAALTKFLDHVQAEHFHGVVHASTGGKVLVSRAMGYSHDSQKTPLKTSTLFELASATKPFTAIAILQLQEQGALELDDPIADHLPGVPSSCREITIRHLVTHKSGIPPDSYGQVSDDMAATISSMLERGPKTRPGEQRAYWNQGYALLSEIIARTSGQSYTEYCKEHIFAPYGMTDTRFTGDSPPTEVSVAVSAASRMGPARTALDHPYGSYGMQYRGMGGMVTNVGNLQKFARAYFDGQVIHEEHLELMRRADAQGYGFGWKVAARDDGFTGLTHNGSVAGFFCEVRLYPDSESCLFVLCNHNDSQLAMQVASCCEDLLRAKRPLTPFPPDQGLLRKFVGKYQSGKLVLTLLDFHERSEFMPASIDWGGPVTRGLLCHDLFGELQFFDGRSMEPVEFQVEEEGPTHCKIGNIEFLRDE